MRRPGKCPGHERCRERSTSRPITAGCGKCYTSFSDYEITSILGETHSFSSKHYWEIFVDNASASHGGVRDPATRGRAAAVRRRADKATEYPLGIQAPGTSAVGHTFRVTVVSCGAKGRAKPLAGATVSVAGHSGKTNSHGTVSLTPDHAGKFVLNATHAGYIRAAPVTVKVS